MNSIVIKAKAKINLSLDVTDKRPDGYHDVKMIMQTLDLHDVVQVEKIPSGIEIACNRPEIPLNEDNIAFKAAKLMIDTYDIKDGVRISIEKNIPVAAGLAGGSTNAAAVLMAINSLFSLNIEEDILMGLGKKIGADVPFCIKGGTMLAEGIGEILTPLEGINGMNVVLVKPNFGVSTPWVYKNLNLSILTARPDTDLVIDILKNKNVDLLANNLVNVLETVTIKEYPLISEIKKKLIDLGALGSLMSGSGPTVFAIFKDAETAKNAATKIKDNNLTVILTHTA